MTREEAIQWVNHLFEIRKEEYFNKGMMTDAKEVEEAQTMVLEALQTDLTKAVPPSLADVYKWERDIALSQLEAYGIGFAKKKRDDLILVVRCKHCKRKNTAGCPMLKMHCDGGYKENDFCSYGERREQ